MTYIEKVFDFGTIHIYVGLSTYMCRDVNHEYYRIMYYNVSGMALETIKHECL